ncbi:hypothetical protein EFL45_09560, partial [Weissella confusa]|uniref:hypothetical protein n=1 Tax=Weissella confusa TaxID=1583 RepID=UPI00223BB928
ILVNIESYKKCSSAISLQGREKSVRKSSIRAIFIKNVISALLVLIKISLQFTMIKRLLKMVLF